jgi:hypothetical protein
VQQVGLWCDDHRRCKVYREEVRTQGLLDKMVNTLRALEMQKSAPHTLSSLLVAVLLRVLSDERIGIQRAVENGLLHVLTHALTEGARQRGGDVMYTLPRMTLCNSIMATTDLVTPFLKASGIVPVLVSYADSKHGERELRVRQIATACLANLSNYDEAVEELICSKALDVLALGLHEYPMEPGLGTGSGVAPGHETQLDEDGKRAKGSATIEHPSVSYMQALSAVVKIVGRGACMGRWGGEGEEKETHGGSAGIFFVRGDRSSTKFDPCVTTGLILDRRSVVFQ